MIFDKRYTPFFLLLTSFFMPMASSASIGLEPRIGDYRFTYDNLLLPKKEPMGLLGGSYLLRKGQWFGGLGTYSAVSGERGGFYTIGLEFGRFISLTPSLRLNLNGFIGGGGGGAAPQGGGLMLRESIMFEYVSGHNAYALGVSAVQFPNGEISSEQLTFAFSRRFESLFSPVDYDLMGLDDDLLSLFNVGKSVGLERYRFSAQLKQYYPSSRSLMTTGKAHPSEMRLLGAKLRYFPMDSLYTGLATYGANGGEVDGFAQLGLIAGIEFPFASNLAGNFEFQLGSAGGGRVETGGGSIVAVEVGLTLLLNPSFSLALDAGYITAPSGEFSAASYGLSVGYQYDSLGISNFSKPLLGGANLVRRDWRVRMLHQSYIPSTSGRGLRKGDSTAASYQQVDLVGISMDLFITPNAYLSGQAIGAYNGGAGGYAVGMFALGYRQPIVDKLSFGGELAVGSAGGGGLAVSSGLVGHYSLSAEYRINKKISLELAVGRFESLEGVLSTNLLQLSLGYRFSNIVAVSR